ncbi:anaerobic sulfatase maturase [Poriferisphaera sp. WC338]|uniref:anaerobic sulfatase maturase n=1 Tax=Poriferisphaera sp. WC338 TaxID=3425129 RepID=UPI003D815272
MIKPVGAACNLDCTYCYYLPTHDLYGSPAHRMSYDTLENLFKTILPHCEQRVSIAWQGGEPTLAGLEFFEKAVALQKQYKKPDQEIENALQTNGTLLDDKWCEFLANNKFLIGLSCDGPPHLHDHYRYDHQHRPSSQNVMRGLKLLQKHRVEYNILTVLNDHNVKHPEDVYNYILNLGARFVQFIPAVEWDETVEEFTSGFPPENPGVKDWVIKPKDYGTFLCKVFDLWNKRHRTHVSIQMIDVMLNQYLFNNSSLCVHSNSCHNQLTVEHDGAIYGCDHYVNARWQIGHVSDKTWKPITQPSPGSVPLTIGSTNEPDRPEWSQSPFEKDWFQSVDTETFGDFATRKMNLPPDECGKCEYQRFCYGGCPKHRPHRGDKTEKTYLCEGYYMFYEHALPKLEEIARHYRIHGELPPPEMEIERQQKLAEQGRHPAARINPNEIGRNDPCPCGSGLKFKKCCGKH